MKNKQPQCPSCGSLNIVYRSTDDTYGCRRCGERFKKKESKSRA